MKDLSKYDKAAAYLRGIHHTFAEACGVNDEEGVWITTWDADNERAHDYRLHETDVDMYAAKYDDFGTETMEDNDQHFRKKWNL